MAAGTRAAEECAAKTDTMQRQNHDEDYSCLVWLLMAILTFAGVTLGWWLRGEYEDMNNKTVKTKTRTVLVQAQTKYTWWCETPRFSLLGERDQGAWSSTDL